MADYPIVMRQLNNSGEYDTLYPASTSDQIEGLLEEATKTAFGLSTSAVPDDIFQKLANTVTLNATYGNLSVGSTVQFNVNGTPTNFLVVHQGNPDPSIYDESCNGTWLLMQDCYESRQWNSSNNSDYANSTINSYLNTTFFGLFDSDVQSQIKQVKIPYVNGTGTSGSVASGVNGLSVKVFLLSGYEVGFTQSDSQYFPIDGTKLDYFESGTGSSTSSKRIAKLNGSATNWWLRSLNTYFANNAWFVNPAGNYGNSRCTNSYGIRPCIIMPSSSLVLPNGTDVTTTISNILGIPDLQTQIETGVKIATGSYVGTGVADGGQSTASSLTLDFSPDLVLIFHQQLSYIGIFNCIRLKRSVNNFLSNGYLCHNLTGGASGTGYAKINDNIMEWYVQAGYSNSQEPIFQLNSSGVNYDYIAFKRS